MWFVPTWNFGTFPSRRLILRILLLSKYLAILAFKIFLKISATILVHSFNTTDVYRPKIAFYTSTLHCIHIPKWLQQTFVIIIFDSIATTNLVKKIIIKLTVSDKFNVSTYHNLIMYRKQDRVFDELVDGILSFGRFIIQYWGPI